MIMRIKVIVLFMSSLSSENYQFLQSQKFRLPKIQFAANHAELSLLSKKLLADSYDRQIRHKQLNSRGTTPSTVRRSENPEMYHPHQPTYIEINMAHVQKEKKAKMKLAKQYQEEKERKIAQERQLRQKKLDEERRMIQSLQQMNRVQEQRKKYSQFSYRRQMAEQLQTAKMKKMHQLQEVIKQRQQFNHKYGNSNNPYLQENSKLNKFKQHFDLVTQAQAKIEKDYLYKWNPIIKTKQDEKEKLIEAGIAKAHSFEQNLNRKREETEQRHRTELRQALQRQIKEKQQVRMNQRLRNKSQSYIPHSYKNLHHPIYNPVDFKMAHDNKRILQQLKQEQVREERLSGLARNGSLVVMPFYPTQ